VHIPNKGVRPLLVPLFFSCSILPTPFYTVKSRRLGLDKALHSKNHAKINGSHNSVPKEGSPGILASHPNPPGFAEPKTVSESQKVILLGGKIDIIALIQISNVDRQKPGINQLKIW